PAPPAVRLLDATAGDSQEPDLEIPESADVERKLHHYRVVPGDSLWAIACRDLGSGSDEQIDRRWRQIYAENREIIGSNPDLIFPGQKLSIPESTDG
ncbi:MAG: LysM peptidoglycan-binding domain-containing protein, partial [Acidimicrobiia bacterium]|nr:LysM peptidoglycan-binding domain-containing protein [Acidimicrobiia bacterium]